MTRTKLIAVFFLALGVVRPAFAGDVPYTLSRDSFVMYYTTAGALHDDSQRWDGGLAARATHPLTTRLHLSFTAQGGLPSEYRFIGGGLTYQFVASTVPKIVNQEAVEIVTYQTWRPFVRLEIGYSSAQAVVHAGLVKQQVVEDLFGIQGSGGIAYALNPVLELNASAYAAYGASPDISMLGFGVCFGMRYSLF